MLIEGGLQSNKGPVTYVSNRRGKREILLCYAKPYLGHRSSCLWCVGSPVLMVIVACPWQAAQASPEEHKKELAAVLRWTGAPG